MHLLLGLETYTQNLEKSHKLKINIHKMHEQNQETTSFPIHN